MIRRIISLIICAAVLCTCAAGCSSLASTAEEKRAVLTVGDYEVPYELYYYVSMNLRRDMPKADDKTIEAEAFEMLSEIYAVFDLAEDYGIAFDDKYIASVADDAAKRAIDECGSKSEYKKALEKNYMNDSVFRFLKKHEQTADEILSALMSSGKYPSTNDAMLAAVLSEDFVAVKQVIVLFEKSVTIGENTYFSTGAEHTKEEALKIAETVLEKAQSGEDFDSLMKEYGESLILGEQYVCRGMWNKAEEEAIFSLSEGQLSAVIEGESGYSVFLAVPKNEKNIEKSLDSITASYFEAQYNILLEKRIEAIEVKPLEAYESYAGKKDEK